jgi:uncharacterized protein (TIGR03086 family)
MILPASPRLSYDDAGRRNRMLDLTPATGMLARVVAGIGDAQLDEATPCRDTSVADLLDHVDSLCLAFTAAAEKSPEGGQPAPAADGSRLAPGWRTRLPARLARLAGAWADEAAWTGMTKAGGLDMPAEVAASVAINEVVVHGWDLAVATGQGFVGEPGLVQAAFSFVQPAAEQNPGGTPGLFGAPVPVPDGAPPLDRLIGLTGRDPGWRPADR